MQKRAALPTPPIWGASPFRRLFHLALVCNAAGPQSGSFFRAGLRAILISEASASDIRFSDEISFLAKRTLPCCSGQFPQVSMVVTCCPLGRHITQGLPCFPAVAGTGRMAQTLPSDSGKTVRIRARQPDHIRRPLGGQSQGIRITRRPPLQLRVASRDRADQR